MTLIPLRPLMEASVKHGPVQGAFNVNVVAQAKAAIGVHEMFRSAAILQGVGLTNSSMGGRCDLISTTLENKKKGAENITRTVKKYGEDSLVSIVLYLDRGRDFDPCTVAIVGGYTTMMIDGSSFAFDGNVELTQEMVKYTHARGVSVEGELGVLTEVEDHVPSKGSTYTDSLKTVKFFRKTGVDILTISHGTMHGASKGKDVKLHKEIAAAIRECLNHKGISGALVPHGSSTTPEYIMNEINGSGDTLTGACGVAVHELQAAARCDISKIDAGTDIRLAVTRNTKELFAGNPDKGSSNSIGGIYELLESKEEQFDPRIFLIPIMDTVMTGVTPDEGTAVMTDCIERGVKKAVGTLIVQFGFCGKTPLVEQVSLEETAECHKKVQT